MHSPAYAASARLGAAAIYLAAILVLFVGVGALGGLCVMTGSRAAV